MTIKYDNSANVIESNLFLMLKDDDYICVDV